MTDDLLRGQPETSIPMGADVSVSPTPGSPPTQPLSPPIPVDVEVELNGKKFKVTPELAEVIKAMKASPEPQPQQQVVFAPPPTQQQQADPLEGLEQLWYTRPREAFQFLEERITKKVRAEYMAERSREKTWETFYSKHPDLKPWTHFVQAAYSKNQSMLGNMSVDKGLDKLAELTRTELLAATSGFRHNVPTQTPPVITEGSSSSTPQATPAPAQTEPPSSLTAALKARKAQRRQSMAMIQRSTR